MHGVLEPLPEPKYRIVTVDAERKRVLVAIRQPGQKVCARIRWMKSRAVMLSAMIQNNTLDFGRHPLPKN